MGEFEDKLNGILSSPKDMERIMELARSMSGGENQSGDARGGEAKKAAPPPEIKDFDPQIMSMLGRLMKEYTTSGDDGKLEILRVMKPYLREERRDGLKRAVEIARMAKLAKIAFSELSGGEKHS